MAVVSNDFLSREIWRKSVHFSGIFFLPVLLWRREAFVGLLASFLVIYLIVELVGRYGLRIPLLSMLTEKCKRPGEKGRLSRGALFLVLAGILTPFLFGPTAAAVGLAQTFVADTTSTLTGIAWGTKKLPWAKKKSWVGSITFLITAFFVSLSFVPWPQALLLGLVGTAVESLPISEMDNLTVPFAVSAAAVVLLR